ncbi:MATE family efflux transporter [Costertonia aggregata]|uniref:Multidrug export protein MepA n=1 Tax=Costertonia aggregata TaxID=343403 RepID=A0A7H9ANX4_9FLAO|nr:MATE family efflux transporter [Costertonia aggregata]QLG45171.1 MATE family efflux transporter [Costertonia aggregata]
MAKISSEELGTLPIGKLLIKQSIPASIGVLVMSLNVLVDSVFVGNWIGPLAIAAISVVLPVTFFVAALGMAIGVGGASIISRALGAEKVQKAKQTFGNQITLTVLVTTIMVLLGLSFADTLIPAFGGKGEIFDFAKEFYTVVFYGVPFLALTMMGNIVIRSEGKPKYAMIAMIIPSVANLTMDYFFIYVFDWGMEGAAWATTVSYMISFVYLIYIFRTGRSELHIDRTHLRLRLPLLKEITSLGSVTLARQAMISLVVLILNNILFDLGGEALVAVYAIIGRILMFALFPVYGIAQGFLPIAGYNYGAEKYARVKESIYKAILYASILGTMVYLGLFLFPTEVASLFLSTKENLGANEVAINQYVLEHISTAMRWVFAATPVIAIPLMGGAYFQAIGKAVPAMLLTLSRQGFFFIPLVFVLPYFYGEIGVWTSFAIADVLATLVTAYYLRRELRKMLA